MKTQQEQWKAVAECNGEYYVSNFGRVKSFKFGKERILKPCKNKKGYNIVRLSKQKVMKTIYIHRLVADAFIDNPHDKPQVNHKDGNKFNNNANNLEWCTSKENNQHAWDNGLNENTRIARCIPVFDVITNIKYNSLNEAAKSIGDKKQKHWYRMVNKSKLQRFFYFTDGEG